MFYIFANAIPKSYKNIAFCEASGIDPGGGVRYPAGCVETSGVWEPRRLEP